MDRATAYIGIPSAIRRNTCEGQPKIQRCSLISPSKFIYLISIKWHTSGILNAAIGLSVFCSAVTTVLLWIFAKAMKKGQPQILRPPDSTSRG